MLNVLFIKVSNSKLRLCKHMKSETKQKLIDKFSWPHNIKNRILLVGIPFTIWFISIVTGRYVRDLLGNDTITSIWIVVVVHILATILFILSMVFMSKIDDWKTNFEIDKSLKNNLTSNSFADLTASFNRLKLTIESNALKSEIEDLRKQNTHLLDILINITHHEGALEEYRAGWEPIVKDELKRRWEQRQILSEKQI